MAHSFRVWCRLVKKDFSEFQGPPFSIKLSEGDVVDDLKRKIKEESPGDLDPSRNLELWKLDDAVTVGEERLDDTKTRLEPWEQLTPPYKPVILVELPAADIGPGVTASRILQKWQSKQINPLPPISDLRRIVDLPLPEDEKIPISAPRFQSLIRIQDPRNYCSPEDVERLFRTVENTGSFLDIFFFAASNPPPTTGSENLFLHFWDSNVRQTLEVIFPDGQTMRNSNKDPAAIRRLRPDYGFILNKLCVFRGEEVGPESNDNPKKELANNFTWTYDPAPYVLGYYATGPKFTLVAISPPPQKGDLPVVHDIASADLRFQKDRIQNICRLINLSGLFQTLADLVRPFDSEFHVSERDICTVEIAGHSIIKTYAPGQAWRVSHLRNIYALLQEKHVPHTDSLVHTNKATVVLSPRGIAEQPNTEKGLLETIICVLEGLQVLHESPQILHRDISWSNVIRCFDDPHRWFIIDWDDATASTPTKAPAHFNRRTHSPAVFTDGHGAEVDIWGVGALILTCKIVLRVSLELQDLGKWMQGPIAPSAQEALDKIKAYQLSLF